FLEGMPRLFIFHRPFLIVNAVCHILSIGIFIELIKLIHYIQYPAKSLVARPLGRPPFPNVVSLYNGQYRFIEGRLAYRIQPFVQFYTLPLRFYLISFLLFLPAFANSV
ncbi:MAG: hypothetical protein LBH43_18700, partial [Treponema sp.]|nr:hypothetical protein [Treponema sp.]